MAKICTPRGESNLFELFRGAKEENGVKERYAFLKFGNSFNRPVQGVVGHSVLWCRGLMTGLLEVSRYLPAPLIERKLM